MSNIINTPLIAVTLKGFLHRDQHCIGIFFNNYGNLNAAIRKTGAVWSATHKCWWVPLNKLCCEAILAACEGSCTINRDALDAYLRSMATGTPKSPSPQRQDIQNKATGSAAAVTKKVVRLAPPTVAPKHRTDSSNKETPQPYAAINPINSHVLPAMQQMLILKGYSPSTQRTYLGEMSLYLRTLGGHAADDMGVQRLKDYLAYCHTQLKLSENTIHSRMNGMKFYYEQVLKKEKLFWEIPRPKKHEQLPKIISVEKIVSGLMIIENEKHKLLLLMAYNAGLRVSEAVRIKLTDIDRDRMQLRVEKSKGKKDRTVPISKTILPILDLYLQQYKPVYWLFEGQDAKDCYSSRSAQLIFKDAYSRLGMPAGLSFHSLRHSYATHLHDNGTDIKFIQELLGHNDIKTTLRYTHVSTRELGKIENPLDAIMRKQG